MRLSPYPLKQATERPGLMSPTNAPVARGSRASERVCARTRARLPVCQDAARTQATFVAGFGWHDFARFVGPARTTRKRTRNASHGREATWHVGTCGRERKGGLRVLARESQARDQNHAKFRTRHGQNFMHICEQHITHIINDSVRSGFARLTHICPTLRPYHDLTADPIDDPRAVLAVADADRVVAGTCAGWADVDHDRRPRGAGTLRWLARRSSTDDEPPQRAGATAQIAQLVCTTCVSARARSVVVPLRARVCRHPSLVDHDMVEILRLVRQRQVRAPRRRPQGCARPGASAH